MYSMYNDLYTLCILISLVQSISNYEITVWGQAYTYVYIIFMI